MDTIIVICSYCGHLIDIKDGEGESGNSHGICSTCLPKKLKELREDQEDILASAL